MIQKIVELAFLAFDRQWNTNFITYQRYHPYDQRATGSCLVHTTSDSSVKPVRQTLASLASSSDIPFLPELSDV